MTGAQLAALVLAGPWLPGQSVEGLQPIRYDDCGERGRQPHVVNGSFWEFAERDASGTSAQRTVAFHAAAVGLRYDDLEPEARYGVRVTYLTERNGARSQRLSAEGTELHPARDLPPGEPETLEFALPVGIAADGVIELAFERVSGPNAVVSEVWLLSDREQPALSVEVDTDLRGEVKVAATQGLLASASGAEVTATLPGTQTVTAQTDADGVASLNLTNVAAAAGDVSLTVTWQGLRSETTLPLSSLFFRRPVLTPIPDEVAGLRRAAVDLGGAWRFSPAPEEGFEDPGFPDGEWSDIEVPGEWVMQGFTVEPNTAGGYRRMFRAPGEWRGMTVRLRFDAVYSRCDVWLNGTHIGGHEGGFTPFELDATGAIAPGKPNLLALAVTNESLADTLASGSQYARHQLGGITRKVTAFAAPRTHITRFHVQTDLDDDFRDATLYVLGEVAEPVEGARLRVILRGPSGEPVDTGRSSSRVGDDGNVRIRSAVTGPSLWDAEHPNLYTLTGELLVGSEVIERVSRRIGFREIEVRGAELLVNGMPVKLHGTCRHEVHPERGRSLTPEIWRRDVELLKGANINIVRTAHYPPAEEFIELCDEAGIYVQDEGPWCWVNASNASSAEALGLLMQSNAEMIERDRSHPSVLFWDLANESQWGSNFARLNEYTRAEDPSRPTFFSYQPEPAPTDIISWHYPGPSGPERAADSEKPITFDEYCHLNCYNPGEVEADPGLRDYWGRALESMWDDMYESPGCLGGTIWCWADDVFDIPGQGRVGYGEWGPVDGFRRPKPEWWHVKKVYSPVHIRPLFIPPGPAEIPVQNRYNHTNLNELECRWRVGERHGALRADIEPRSDGVLVLPTTLADEETLELEFIDATGRVVDQYAIPVGEPAALPTEPGASGASWIHEAHIILTEQETGREVVLPDEVRQSGETEIDYEATYSGEPIVVREVGLKLTLPGSLHNLSWERFGQWTVYPDDHIGRLVGEAIPFPVAEGDPRPDSWSLDYDPRGCNDFRSTKYDILEASLADAEGRGIAVRSSGGNQHIRAQVAGDEVLLYVLDFSNGGGERFLGGHYQQDYRMINPGDAVSGTVHLHLLRPEPDAR